MAEAGSAGGSVPPDATDEFPSEEYECKICYNYFDLDLHTPKLLNCSHTFCQGCLDALHFRDGRGWRIGCPVCRRRTLVPEHRVHNLPDDTAVTEALAPKTHAPSDSSADARAGRAASPVAAPETSGGCQTCKRVAFATGCVCAIFSFLSTAVLLFLGLIFVQNVNKNASRVGHACLFVASVLALLALILTWLTCMLKYRPETDASNFSSLTQPI